MTFDTRIFFLIKKFVFKLKEKTYIFKKSFTMSFFILLAGFLFGNLFGTFLNILRFFIPWDGFILLLILLILEIISFLSYQKKYSFFIQQPKNSNPINKNIINQRASHEKDFSKDFSAEGFLLLNKNENRLIYKNLNFMKIGLMFGFFIDAFKVGS